MVNASANITGTRRRPFGGEPLPPINTRRWVPRRKAAVVAAVAGELLTAEEACDRYSLTVEEFAEWQRLYDFGGVKGLRTTRVREYREMIRAADIDSAA